MNSILLVDDDAGVRKSVGEMLMRSGYAVRVARDGEAALELLGKDAEVSLVIADHRMPGMSGLMLARRIRDTLPDLPVVIMTGYSDLESYQCAANLGVVRYIGKPIGLRKLQETVRDAVAAGRGTAPPAQTLAGGS